jgi:hypothetical protein
MTEFTSLLSVFNHAFTSIIKLVCLDLTSGFILYVNLGIILLSEVLIRMKCTTNKKMI